MDEAAGCGCVVSILCLTLLFSFHMWLTHVEKKDLAWQHYEKCECVKAVAE